MQERGLERFLKGSQVWCSYKKDGCEWKGKTWRARTTSESKSISRESAERVSVCGSRVHTRVWGVVPASITSLAMKLSSVRSDLTPVTTAKTISQRLKM